MGNPVRTQINQFRRWKFAKTLRENPTEAEVLMWNHISRTVNPNLPEGWFFRRQSVVCGVIPDFYCEAAEVALEVDGPIHKGFRQRDVKRDGFLNRHGVYVLRVRNEDVYDFKHAEAIALKLLNLCSRKSEGENLL